MTISFRSATTVGSQTSDVDAPGIRAMCRSEWRRRTMREGLDVMENRGAHCKSAAPHRCSDTAALREHQRDGTERRKHTPQESITERQRHTPQKRSSTSVQRRGDFAAVGCVRATSYAENTQQDDEDARGSSSQRKSTADIRNPANAHATDSLNYIPYLYKETTNSARTNYQYSTRRLKTRTGPRVKSHAG